MKKNGNRKAKTQKKRMLFTTFFKAQKKSGEPHGQPLLNVCIFTKMLWIQSNQSPIY